MGSSQSQSGDDLIEVYLLFKELGADRYTRNQIRSHHTCLFKCKNGSFYYTDLDVDEKDGPCQLHMGRYKFLSMPIYYKPIGFTRKTLNQIEEWVMENKTAGTPYKLVFNDCQCYARSCLEFLQITRNYDDSLHVQRMTTLLIGGPVGSELLNLILDKTVNCQCADSPAELCISRVDERHRHSFR